MASQNPTSELELPNSKMNNSDKNKRDMPGKSQLHTPVSRRTSLKSTVGSVAK